MATINKIDLNGDTYDIESSALVTTQPTTPSEWATYYDTVNDEVKVYDGSNWNSVWWGGSVAFATSSTAWNVAEKEVSVPSITTLNVWQILCVQPTASATVANLTIKLNNFPAYPIRYNNGAITTTTDDVVWSQDFVSQFVFDGTYRQFVSHGYDKDSIYTQNVLFDRGGFVSGSGTYAITRYSICLQKPDMTWETVTNTEEDYSVANNKTVNTHWFLLNGEMLYYSNTTVLANGAVSAANTMYRQNSGFDIRYSMNTTGSGYTAGDYIYFVGTIGVDGLFYLDATQWWTNTLPSTNNGKVYVKVWKYVSGVTITLELDHPAYYHDGTRIREYVNADNKQDKALVTTLNNADNNHYPTAKAVADAIQSAGGGDMMASTYDPNNVNANAFDYTNFINTPTIPTKVSDLTNDSGFITSSYHDSTKQDTLSTQTAYTSKGTTTKVPQISTNTLWQVTSITEKNIAFPVTSVNGSTWAVTVNEPKVSATAPSSPTEWVIWYDTTNDVLKTYDWSNWNECWAWWGWVEVFDITQYGTNWDWTDIITSCANNDTLTILLDVWEDDDVTQNWWVKWLVTEYDDWATSWTWRISAMALFNLNWVGSAVPYPKSNKLVATFNATTKYCTGITQSYTEFVPTNSWSTGNVLTKTANGYEWQNVPATWLQESPNSTITGIKYIRHWTEADYANLSQYYTDTPWDTEFHCF